MQFGKKQALDALSMLHSSEDFLLYAQHLFADQPVAARNAAWVLTQASDEQLLALLPLRNRLIDLVMSTPNVPLRRLSLNLLLRLPLSELRTDFLNFCLDHMQDPKETVGVQALCMKMACRQCAQYPELKKELLSILQLMEPEFYQPGLLCVRRHILQGKGV